MTKPVVALLSVLAAIAGVVAGVSLWADLSLVNGDRFARSAASGLATPAASQATGRLAAESVVGDSSLLEPLREPLADAVADTLRTPSSRPVLQEAAQSAHSVVVDGTGGPVQVNLTTVYGAVRQEVRTSDPDVAELMPDVGDLGSVTLIDASELPNLSGPANVIPWIWAVALFVAAALLATAIWFAENRRFALVAASAAVAVAGIATWALVEMAPDTVAAAVPEEEGRAVAQGMVEELIGNAGTIALGVFAAGAVIAAISIAWPRGRKRHPPASGHHGRVGP